MKLSKRNLARLAAGKLPEPTEDATQAVIIDGLRAHGYLVQSTSRRMKRCQHCRKYSSHGDGCSKGIGDLLVRNPSWKRGMWLSMEIKKSGPIKWSSPEQRLLVEAGDVVLVQSFEQALRAVREFES